MSHLFQVSAKDHSAVVFMSVLADASSETWLSLEDVAKMMHLSHGYLEHVAGDLKAAGLIIGRPGPRGGYRLAQAPERISLEDILVAVNGPVELVECQGSSSVCPVADHCSSRKVWGGVQQAIRVALQQTTLAANKP